MSNVGLFAHPSKEDSVETMEHDVIALGMALIAHGHHILLHASSSLALPLMLAAGSHRAPVVLEGSQRRESPLSMMPMKTPTVGEDPDAALFAKVSVGSTASGEFSKETPMEISLFEQLVALGIVDPGQLGEPADSSHGFLAEKKPRAVVCMGWDQGMATAVEASETLSRNLRMPMIIAGPPRGPMLDSKSWVGLRSYLEPRLPEVPMPEPEGKGDRDVTGERSEAYVAAWKYATERAEMVFMADQLARQLTDNFPDAGSMAVASM